MPSRSKTGSKKALDLDPVSARIEFLIGLSLLPPDATENDRVAIARRVGLDSAAIGRIFKKTDAAARKALQRAAKG